MKASFDVRSIFQMPFPAMSVYEFYGYMQEKEVLEYWENSTIYFICQRPVIYFNELILSDGGIKAKIKQRSTKKEISFYLPLPIDSEINPSGEDLDVDIKFYTKKHKKRPPLNNIAGFQLFDKLGKFIVWLTPERLIYDHLIRGLYVEFDGDYHQFLNYQIHYIGQAQDQKIWERLRNHQTLQNILVNEHPYIEGEFAPYEFVLIFLQLTGADKINMLKPEITDFDGENLRENVIQNLENIRNEKFIDRMRVQLTNDIEAYLVNHFEPPKNRILFKNYPMIAKGLKSIGANEIIHDFFVLGNLKTEEGSYSIKTNPIYMKNNNE